MIPLLCVLFNEEKRLPTSNMDGEIQHLAYEMAALVLNTHACSWLHSVFSALLYALLHIKIGELLE